MTLLLPVVGALFFDLLNPLRVESNNVTTILTIGLVGIGEWFGDGKRLFLALAIKNGFDVCFGLAFTFFDLSFTFFFRSI